MTGLWENSMTWLAVGIPVALLLLALPVGLAGAYLLGLTLLSRRLRQTSAAVAPDGYRAYFDIIVPAHDEAGHIADTVRNLLALDWPHDRFRVLVIADNCTDDTALQARAAGARVIERQNRLQRGKGHALRHAFAVSLAQGLADAMVVVDADSVASPNLLAALAARLQSGAQAVQVFHGVLDAGQTPRTRLMAIAFTGFHRVRSRGRERLGLSCGLRGNGWCITRMTLLAVPYRAYALAEDIEYGLRLGLAGIRVHYADEAAVLAMMHTDSTGAASQRRRWEEGRWQLLRASLGPLFAAEPAASRWLRVDLALDLLLPPLAVLATSAIAVILLCVAALLLPVDTGLVGMAVAIASLALLALAIHGFRSWRLSGTGQRGLFDLWRLPGLFWWKLGLLLRPSGNGEWIRTRRFRE